MVVAAAAAGVAATAKVTAQEATEPRAASIVDTHVYVGRWPFRRLRADEPAALVEHLGKHHVVEAWAGSFEALLHDDMAGVNERLAETCREHTLLRPVGCVNPMLPDWEEELRRCHEQYDVAAIRLHPNYHRYNLGDEVFARLIKAAEERGLLVQIAALMEDIRTHHPLMVVPNVDLRPLAAQLKATPKLRVQVLNGLSVATAAAIGGLKDMPNVHFDFAWLDAIRCVEDLIGLVGVERICFGSYSPMLYFESAVLKMRESMLPPDAIRAICTENPRRLMGAARA